MSFVLLAPWPFKTSGHLLQLQTVKHPGGLSLLGLWGFSKAPPVAGIMQMVEMMFERKTQETQKSPLVFFSNIRELLRGDIKGLVFCGVRLQTLDAGNHDPSHRQLPREAPHIGSSSGIPNDPNVAQLVFLPHFCWLSPCSEYWRYMLKA